MTAVAFHSMRILIVSPFGIGDVLFTTPLIEALKKAYPDVQISYLANARTAPFLENDPRVNRVFIYDRDEFVAVYKKSPINFLKKWRNLIADIRAEKFDVAFDLSMNSGLGLALFMAGIPVRLGHDYKGRGRFLTHKESFKGYEDKHVVEYHCELLKHLGIEAQDRFMKMFVAEEDEAWAKDYLEQKNLVEKKIVCVYPGGGASWGGAAHLKRWPSQNFVELVHKIIEKASAHIILMGSPGEVELCREILAGFSDDVSVLAGETSLGQAVAIMQHAVLVIANDGGPLHMAVACGVKSLGIFGPVDEKVYGPYPVLEKNIVVKDISCRPCYHRFRMSDCQHLSCLQALNVDEVFKKVEGLLK